MERSFCDYCKIFAKMGHESMAIVDTRSAIPAMIPGTNISAIRCSGPHSSFAKRKIKQIISENKIDKVFLHCKRSMMIVKAILHETDAEIIPIVHLYKTANIITNAKKHICVNHKIASRVNGNAYFVPNAIEVTEPPKPFSRRSKGNITIGYLGRLGEEKGPFQFIDAMYLLHKKGIKCDAIMAGSGPIENSVHFYANERGLSETIKFPGWISDKKEFFDKIDIFCLPSLEESFGIVILESMMHGKPVIATNADGPIEIIRNMENGILIERAISPLIAMAAENLIASPDVCARLVQSAYKDVVARFSYEAMRSVLNGILAA